FADQADDLAGLHRDGEVADRMRPIRAGRQRDREVLHAQHRAFHSFLDMRGSRVSRRPSPSMFTARTVSVRKTPGIRMLWGSSWNTPRPSAMMLPQVGASGGMPTRRRLRSAPSRVAEPQTWVAGTSGGARVFGSTWR